MWQRYCRGLVALGREKLGGCPRAAADEEDVALSAFDSFIRRAEDGVVPATGGSPRPVAVLIVITTRKARRPDRAEGRGKRDWRRVQGRRAGDEDGSVMRLLIGREPDPAFAAQVAEECQRLLALLPDATCAGRRPQAGGPHQRGDRGPGGQPWRPSSAGCNLIRKHLGRRAEAWQPSFSGP